MNRSSIHPSQKIWLIWLIFGFSDADFMILTLLILLNLKPHISHFYFGRWRSKDWLMLFLIRKKSNAILCCGACPQSRHRDQAIQDQISRLDTIAVCSLVPQENEEQPKYFWCFNLRLLYSDQSQRSTRRFYYKRGEPYSSLHVDPSPSNTFRDSNKHK